MERSVPWVSAKSPPRVELAWIRSSGVFHPRGARRRSRDSTSPVCES